MRGRRDGSRLEIPAALEQLPRDLKGDEGLAGAGGQRQQDAVLSVGDRFQHPIDGDFLIVADLANSRPCLRRAWRRSGRARRSGLGKGQVPEFIGRRVARQLAFGALLHVDAVDALAVGGVGEADGQLARVVLRLRHAFGQRLHPTPWPRRRPAWCCDRPAHNRRVSGLPRRPWPSMRPSVIGYSRRMRLPSTTPQPAASSAGSICSALVSASFMASLLKLAAEGLVRVATFSAPPARSSFCR